jgi:hypothetical protein
MMVGMHVARLGRLVGMCLLLLAPASIADAQLRAQPFIGSLSMPVAIVPDPDKRWRVDLTVTDPEDQKQIVVDSKLYRSPQVEHRILRNAAAQIAGR